MLKRRKSLITAIDYSESKDYSKYIFVLVCVKENNIPQLMLSDNYEFITKVKEVIIDDTVFKRYMKTYEGQAKLILESYAKGFRKAFILLAENIANIYRRLIIENNLEPYKIIRKFKKIKPLTPHFIAPGLSGPAPGAI